MSMTFTLLALTLAGEPVAQGDASAAPEKAPKKPLVEIAPIQEHPISTEETEASYVVGVLVHTPLNVNFDNTPARDAFNAVIETIDLPIVVRYASEAQPIGIDPDLPLTIEFRNRRALLVLETMIDLAAGTEDCTWQIRNGYVEIGPKTLLNAQAARSSRVYLVADLLLEPPHFGNAPAAGLMGLGVSSRRIEWDLSNLVIFDGQPINLSRPEAHRPYRMVGDRPRQGFGHRKTPEEVAEELVLAIAGTVEPRAWDVNGGQIATIRYFQHGLIINAPDYIHRQVGGYPTPMSPEQIARVRAGQAGAGVESQSQAASSRSAESGANPR